MRVIFILIITFSAILIYGQNPFNNTFGTILEERSAGIMLLDSNRFIISLTDDGLTNGPMALYVNSNGDSLTTNVDYSFIGFQQEYNKLSNNLFYATGGYYVSNESSHDVLLQVIDTNSTLLVKKYGGSDYDYGTDIICLPDSGFMIVGTTKSYDATGYFDVYIIRTDKNGDSLWTRTFGGYETQWAYGIEKESDSVYVVAGKWGTPDGYLMDAFAMKINLQGDTSNFKRYGNTHQNFGNALCKTSDGGYAIAGWSTVDYGSFYSEDAVLYKIDSNLNLLWTKTYGALGDQDIFDVISTYDNGFVLVGHSEVYDKGDNVYIVRTDSQGDTLWTKTIGGEYNERAFSVVQTPDSGFAIVGDTYSYGAGDSDAFFLKLKPNGETTVSIGLQAEPNALNINIYPNPAKDNLTMDFTNSINSESEMIIYNSLGQIIKELKVNKLQSSISISIVGLNSGVYFCELRTANKTVGRGKFIKQ